MDLNVWAYCFIQQVFVQSPAFHHQASDAVPVYRMPEFFFRYGKAGHYGAVCFVCSRHCKVYEPYRKNRKRFPGAEKRINMLLFFEPLIYFKSITNGWLF